MAKWITCKDDPSFYRCSKCGYTNDWRDHICDKCGEHMEDTKDVIVEWEEYAAVQSGGNHNITVSKNKKMIMHAQYRERLSEDGLLEYLKRVMYTF